MDSDGKLLYQFKECIDKFPYTIKNEQGKNITIQLKEKRVVTYTPSLAKKQTREIKKLIESAKKHRAYSAKRSEYGDSAKYVIFESTDTEGKVTDGQIKGSMNQEAIDKSLSLAGYNMIITSETNLTAEYIISTYRNQWRIEESFRVMKSYLDARPVYLQKEASPFISDLNKITNLPIALYYLSKGQINDIINLNFKVI